MPSRINVGFTDVVVSGREQRDLTLLRDNFARMLTNDGGVTANEVQALLSQVTRDRQVSQAEVALLSQGFHDNQQFFLPDAAMMMQDFLSRYGGQPAPMPYVPAPMPSRGWSPYGAAGVEHSDMTALRQNIGMMLDRNRPMSGFDARALIQRATQNPAIEAQAVQLLAETFQMTPHAFSPEAAGVMRQFLATYQPSYGAFNQPVYPQPGFQPTYPQPGYNPYGSDAFVSGPVQPMSRRDVRDVTRLQNLFTNLIANDGGVTPNEVHTLISQATRDGQLTIPEAQLLAQGFRDNENRFTADAAQMMRQFLAQYGVW